MKQVLFGGYYSLTDDTDTEYNSVIGGRSWTPTEFGRLKLVSTDGKIKNLRVKLNGSPGVGKHYDFTLMVNGNPTALTLEIADAATSGSNMVNEIDVAPSDYISIQIDPDNTPTTVIATWTFIFEGDTVKESLIMGGTSSTLHNIDTEYCTVMTGFTNYSVVEDEKRQVVPTAGTIKDFYVKLNEDPGTAPDAYRFTVRLNGATVAQSLIVTITAENTTGSDLVHNLAVVAGDVLTMMVEPLNGPSATPQAVWGMTFVADIDGESIVIGGTSDDLDNTLTECASLIFYEVDIWTVTELLRNQLGQSCTLKKLHMLLSAAPGDGKSYTFTVRIAGANSNVVAVVADAATTGNSGALEDTVATDDYVNLQVVPAGTPDVVDAYWGLVSVYVPPPPYTPENKSANMGAKMVAAGLI